MAAGLPLPKQILAHAHWTMGKQKMSKSRGNVADPFEVIKDYGVDPVRYYLVRDGGLADDGGRWQCIGKGTQHLSVDRLLGGNDSNEIQKGPGWPAWQFIKQSYCSIAAP